MFAVSVIAMALTVAVDRVRLDVKPPPIVERGRVLLPVRAIFTALGADVSYDASVHTVTVERNDRHALLTLDSRQAFVNGRLTLLDVPARERGGRAFVPLRFVAEALGARVSYDGARRAVEIDRGEGALADATSVDPPTVVDRHPAPGETVISPFPSIWARIETHGGDAVDGASVRVFLDARDVTDRLQLAGDAVAYTPSRGLSAGVHEVTVQGADQSGTRFTANWDFTSVFTPPGTGAPVAGLGGFLNNGPGTFYAPALAQFILTGPAGGSGYATLCGSGQQYVFSTGSQPTQYVVAIPIPQNVFAPACYVSGLFYDRFGNPSYVVLANPLLVNTTVNAPPTPHIIHIRRTPAPIRTPIHVHPPTVHVRPSATPRARPTPTAVPRHS